MTISAATALGPDAVAAAIAEFQRLGAAVVVAPSPWRLGPAERRAVVDVARRLGRCSLRARSRAGRPRPAAPAPGAGRAAHGHRRPRRPARRSVEPEPRRERVAQQHHVADLADLGERRPPVRVPRERPSRTNRGARESPTKNGATTSCSSSARSSVRNCVCTVPPPSTISRCTPRAPRSSLSRRISTGWPPSTTVATGPSRERASPTRGLVQ